MLEGNRFSEIKGTPVAVFWFRRDLRLNDNKALAAALESGLPVLPIFIFDDKIIASLPQDDPRVWFIYSTIKNIDDQLRIYGSSLSVFRGDPVSVFQELTSQLSIAQLYFNNDFEPYSKLRDQSVVSVCEQKHIAVFQYCDHVIFRPNAILKKDGTPYTVFTPYKKQWLSRLRQSDLQPSEIQNYNAFIALPYQFPSPKEIDIQESHILVRNSSIAKVEQYEEIRDFPALDGGTYLGPHLRFGTVSIREILQLGLNKSHTFLDELIWREFFIQILNHFPEVTNSCFRRKYNALEWRNNEAEFTHWCNGTTGYPWVDAGMCQLNTTGYMHNRVRMVVASFLCKHLRIDWRWGESYFAEKLLDYELASNNGNWQWAAGTGCDAAPYFRVFNPTAQQKKFDSASQYIYRWIPEYDPSNYMEPIVEHSQARIDAINMYKKCV